MITPFFSLEEIRQRIFDDDTTKAIKLDRDHSGGKRKIYICHDCMHADSDWDVLNKLLIIKYF